MHALGRRIRSSFTQHTGVEAGLGYKTLFHTKKNDGKKWPTVVVSRTRTFHTLLRVFEF